MYTHRPIQHSSRFVQTLFGVQSSSAYVRDDLAPLIGPWADGHAPDFAGNDAVAPALQWSLMNPRPRPGIQEAIVQPLPIDVRQGVYAWRLFHCLDPTP